MTMTRFMSAAVAMLSCALLSACGSTWMPGRDFGAMSQRVVSQDSAGGEVGLLHGQRLLVRLPLAAEEGYAWTLREPTVAAVKPEGAPGEDREAGLVIWTFTPVRDGEQTLRLEYRRTTEDYTTAPARTVSYNVTVK
jgi:predicted secreted protein